MKRVFQSAATILVLVLGLQPALAGLVCGPGSAMRSCSMSMNAMGTGCPMAHGLLAGCARDCCAGTLLKTLVLPPVAPKPKSLIANAWFCGAFPVQAAAVSEPGVLIAVADSSSPPRFLLNRTFRI